MMAVRALEIRTARSSSRFGGGVYIPGATALVGDEREGEGLGDCVGEAGVGVDGEEAVAGGGVLVGVAEVGVGWGAEG